MLDQFQPDKNNPDADAELENRLREHYAREDPPDALTARILARARQQAAAAHPPQPKGHGLRRHASLLSFCSALVVFCAFLALAVVRRHRLETRRAQVAQARLLYALQITTRELGWAAAKAHRDLTESPGAPPAVAVPARVPKGAN